MKFPNFLRIASVPLMQIVDVNETTSIQKEVMDHHDAKLTKIISENLKFSYDTVTPSDRQWGRLTSDGNWSGMVGLMERNETDLIISCLSVTEGRARVMDFSYPYLIDSMVFITRPLEKAVGKQSFLKPFSTVVWIYLCANILILPILHMMLFRRKPTNGRFEERYRNILHQSSNAPASLADSFLSYSWWIFQAVIRWSYAAVLLSVLTLPSLTGVRNIPELANAVRRGSYECTSYPRSYVADVLLNSQDANSKTLGQCLNKSAGHPEFDVALSNNKLSKRLVYIGRRSQFVDAEAKYFISEDGFLPEYWAIGVKKDFCCKDQLDSTIHYIIASGIYDKLKKDYFRKIVYKMLWNPLNKDSELRQLSLADLQGVFILLTSGYSLAMLMLLLEVVCAKQRNPLIKKMWKREKEIGAAENNRMNNSKRYLN